MITAGKLCRFVYAAPDALRRRMTTTDPAYTRSPYVILFGGYGWKSYPIDTVFVLLDNEEYTWKVLTPTGEVGNVYKTSYDIWEADRDHK